jgi:S1-C subfamily serine protease
MSAPRRLWSGDWRQESADLSEELAARRAGAQAARAETAPPPTREPENGTVRSRRRGAPAVRISPRLKKVIPIALAALLILAGAAYGLNAVLDSPGTPAGAATSQPSRSVLWLGMQIESVLPGAAVVDTVALGSSAERAGMEPGDVIVAVNGRAVHSAGDITDALAGLGMGDAVEIQASRGSTPFTTHATLAAPPVSNP